MAISFAAGATYIQTAGAFAELETATVMFWMFPRSVTGSNRFMGTDSYWENRLDNADMLHEFRQGGGAANMTTVFALNTWYHVAFQFDGTNAGAFVNGVPDPAWAVATQNDVGTDTALSIGSATWNAAQGADCIIEDVRIYNSVLPQREVENIYNSDGNDDLIDGMAHWWPLNEGVEGAVVASTDVRDMMGGIDMSVIVGSPIYEASRRINSRRMTSG